MASGKSKIFCVNRANWFVCDFETITPKTNYYKETQDTKVNLWGAFKIYEEDREKAKTAIGITIEEFVNWIKNYESSLTLFFHNLTFDGDFILKYLLNVLGIPLKSEKSKKFKVGLEMFKAKNKNYYFVWSFYGPRRGNKKGKEVKVYFRCSLQLLSSGVEALGKSLGINKHVEGVETFYHHEPFKSLSKVPENFIKYLWGDCEIVARSMVNFEKAIKTTPVIEAKEHPKPTAKNPNPSGSVLEVWNSLTAGSLSKLVQKNFYIHKFKKNNPNLKKVDFFHISNREDYIRVGQAFRGGWTQFNPEFQNGNKEEFNGCEIDINSSYPAQMANLLPYGDILLSPPRDNPYITFVEVTITKAIIKQEFYNIVSLPNFNKKGDNRDRYIRELNTPTIYHLIKEEWDLYKHMYDITYSNIDRYYMRAAPFLEPFINEFYSLKRAAKASGNKGLELGYKILLNSSYGKFSQRLDFEALLYWEVGKPIELYNKEIENTLTIGGKEYKVLRKTNSYKISDKHDCYIIEEVKDKYRYPNIAVAVVVTAMARVQLFRAIIEVGPRHFIYSDTDSIKFKTQDLKGLKCGDELGEWKYETEITSIEIYGAKRLRAYKGLKIVSEPFAGVTHKRNLSNMDYNKSEQELLAIGLKKAYTLSGIVLIDTDLLITRGDL